MWEHGDGKDPKSVGQEATVPNLGPALVEEVMASCRVGRDVAYGTNHAKGEEPHGGEKELRDRSLSVVSHDMRRDMMPWHCPMSGLTTNRMQRVLVVG